MLYIQYYIKSVHFWLKYNGLAIVRKTTKLIEGGHRGLQDYRYVTIYTPWVKKRRQYTLNCPYLC